MGRMGICCWNVSEGFSAGDGAESCPLSSATDRSTGPKQRGDNGPVEAVIHTISGSRSSEKTSNGEHVKRLIEWSQSVVNASLLQ